METKHTPGPWQVLENAKGAFQHGICTDNLAPVPAVIAFIDIKSVNTDKESRAANARLIAAAPELLAALQWALDDPDSEILGSDWDEAARAAIAKATGQ